MLESLKNIDVQLFQWINGHHNGFLDVVMYWATQKYTWIPLYLFLLFLVRKKLAQNAWTILPAIAVLVLLSDQISVHCFKEVFQRYRPCHNLLLKDTVHLIDGCGGQYGFVSSHAANTFALAGFLSLLFKSRRFTLLIMLWALFVSYSRVYGGVHYPGDIIGGAFVGLALAALVFILYGKLMQRSGKKI